ncbi:ankyrin repeat domain-containing protein [Wolbachia endosymbiont (group A) of Pogonocherus hispidulus]|uniref:ankyrin repeat domain-containing protein n=1 Tax=Wolbachia endosymbiont (group A) of Pogonocherus hispidulus TaxID=3066136 RepID=UPI00334110A6
MQEILVAVNCSQGLNKENIADKIKAEIEAKSNERNLGAVEKFLKRWEKDNFDLKKFPCGDLLQFAAKFNCAKLAKVLIENGFDVNEECFITSLHQAAQSGSLEVAKLLLENGANVNATDGMGSPLHYAAKHGKTEVIELLLENKADINMQNRLGETPLHWAARDGAVEAGRLLSKKDGIKIDLEDRNGLTPLHYSIIDKHMDRTGDLAKILLEKGADPNFKNNWGCTPFYYAVNSYNDSYSQPEVDIELVKLLLEKGANVNLQYKDEGTILSYCINYSHRYKPLIKLLLDHGADPSCIHKPKAITAGITVGVISAVVVPLVLAYATALPALAIIGITVASALIVGGISYGVAYKSSEHSLNSKLSEVSCSNVDGNKQTVQP